MDTADFDKRVNRLGTHSAKWDMMKPLYGVPESDGISMWVADMDFKPPACVQRALQKTLDHGIYGYYGNDAPYREAIKWWMKTRHGWDLEADWIFTTHGLVNGTAMCVETFTQPGDGVILFTPVYHAFFKVIRESGRIPVECELANRDGRYEMDFGAYEAMMTGGEKMAVLCSPHNPGGRVWTEAELQQLADFCKRHDLILVSDEIHHDLTFPGNRHIPMASASPDISDRLIMMTSATKVFNIAGSHCGNVIIENPDLRSKMAKRMAGLGLSPNSFGLFMAEAAYSPEGAEWVDQLMAYLNENRKVFDEGISEIPGLRSMPLEATYLAWVDFSNTGMEPEEFTKRVQDGARIAANHGSTFGKGGDSFLRFNLGTQRSLVKEAVERIQEAFSDLQ